ncbi:MAG: O-antigen ligase family protein [Saprospiraceae bacterium]|nr:O-antigen ligase family protein [Saprospiraceae bacterium]
MDFRISNTISEKKVKWILAIAGIVLMFYGFMFSRVVSNIGFVLIGVYTLFHFENIKWLFRDKWMITFILIAMVPLISDIWYEGIHFYEHRGIMKFLLVLFPCFVFAFKPDQKTISIINYLFIATMLFCTVYSLMLYFTNFNAVNEEYKTSKVMEVLSYRDHIRISWAIVISCFLAGYEWARETIKYKKILIFIYITFQIGFLHMLGAKTGLISLYFGTLILILYAFWGYKKWSFLLLIPILAIMPFFAYKTIPSLRQRINFVKYDFQHYSKGEYRAGLSDAVRFYSLKAGKDIISEHVLFGVGFSRLQAETESWYKRHMPEMTPENYFLPSSELVIYWASGGVFGLLVFLCHIILPFFKTYLIRNKLFIAFFLPAICSFAYETHLEGQLPLFIYGFFTAWFWYLSYQNHFLDGN